MTLPDLEFYCPYTDNCYECCLETEMPLGEKDITRIEKLGFQIDEFLVEKEGFMVLRNINNQCCDAESNKESYNKPDIM